MFKKLFGAVILMLVISAPALAAGDTYPWDRAPNKITDMAALRNGAKLFVNYCLNCHSASALRYNKLMDLGFSEEQITRDLLFTGGKVGDLMKVAMTVADAKKWFGAAPPDLSVMARAKDENLGQPGTDYIYTYLRTFYRDNSSASGWNNLVFPKVAMINPLAELSGPRELTTVAVHEVESAQGKKSWHKTTTLIDADGFASTLSDAVLPDYKGHASVKADIKYLDPAKQAKFENDVADLTAFLGWMSEPDQVFRKKLGMWVLLFLALFFVVAWRLNATYWKHIK